MLLKTALFNSILFLTFSLNAQIANYQFENNLTDGISNYNASYLNEGNVSSNPTYLSGSSGQGVFLGPLEGIALPVLLNSELDTSSSIEIEFDFKITDLGDGNGQIYLLSMQSTWGENSPGISVFARADIFSPEEDYEVVFNYSDGGFDLGVPDHPGHNETRIGFFNVDELVDLRLILDFKNNKWVSLVGAKYTTNFFDSYYDFSHIKETILEDKILFGWSRDQENEMVFSPNQYTSSAIFDNISISSPRKPGNPSLLREGLIAMKNHVTNTNVLSDAELQSKLVQIQLNYQGNFLEAEAAIYEYLTSYEERYEPVFSDRQQVEFQFLSPEAQTLIFLQQAIHDDQFTLDNISNMEGVFFEAAEAFPGKVSESATRTSNQTIEINGSYSIIQGARIAADLEDTRRPTGFYAAPGELINITIPETLLNVGLKAMIGAHDADHSTLTNTNRFVRVSKTYALNKLSTIIANPFGGAIYIKFPEGSDLGWFDVNIDGAVKSPYFSTRTDRASNLTDWLAEIANNDVEWVDFESDKFMMTLPLNHVSSQVTDPTFLLNKWDNIMDGYRYVGGRPYERARAEYFLVDSRLPTDSYGTGYPQIVGVDDAGTQTYPTQILKPEFYKTDFFVTLHELGHLALHPTLLLEVESIVHLNAAYIYNTYYELPLDSAFKYSSNEFMNMDETTMDWMIAYNFRNNNSMDCDPTMDPLPYVCHELIYQHRGHAKYVEMADMFGWSSVHEMNKYFYDKWTTELDETKVVTPDDIIFASSEATGYNMAPLMHFWGLQPSTDLAEQLSLLPKSPKILDKLSYYKTIVPTTKEEFQVWYDAIYSKKDPNHNQRYDNALANFDSENYGAEMISQIDFLIATYFPGANAETDFLSFSLAEETMPVILDVDAHSILSQVSFQTDRTLITPSFLLSTGASTTVDDQEQISDNSTIDFTTPVQYLVVAQDNLTSQNWTITVDLAANTETKITSFSFNEQTSEATIGEGTIDIEVSYGTDLTSLIPILTISENATINLDNGIPQDFTNPITYKVFAEDGINMQEWIVAVSLEKDPLGVNTMNENVGGVHPNPVDKVLNMHLVDFSNEAILISISDISGKQIMITQMIGAQKLELDVHYLQSGFYLIQIQQGVRKINSRFIKN
jgi:hypothetical protein